MRTLDQMLKEMAMQPAGSKFAVSAEETKLFKGVHSRGLVLEVKEKREVSDGSTASYYELPSYAKELQHLISYKNMNAQIGEIFRACYRYGEVEHSPEIRDIKKIIFYAKAELKRLKRLKRLEKAAELVESSQDFSDFPTDRSSDAAERDTELGIDYFTRDHSTNSDQE